MRAILSAHENWETTIAPRLILGLWHPKFVGHAVEILPNIKRCFIGMDLTLAQYPIFWNACDAFSISFPALATADGELFRQRCRCEGKDIFTWTCNRQEEWALAAAWNLDVVMTDTPSHYLAERKAVTGASRPRYSRCSVILSSLSTTLTFIPELPESEQPIVPRDAWFMWKSLHYYSLLQWLARRDIWKRLEQFGGPVAPYIDL